LVEPQPAKDREERAVFRQYEVSTIPEHEVIYAIIGTAKLNGVDPETWLRHVLARIADHPVSMNGHGRGAALH
jgi:hypothetical protein